VKIIVFGAGTVGEVLLADKPAGWEVLFVADNDPSKWGTTFVGHEVKPPEAILREEYDLVHIACGATIAIRDQLLSLGVKNDKITAPLLERKNLQGLQRLTNLHKGRRAFIVGNGPSLRVEDLTLIDKAKDISFAFNKIFLAFDQTPYRPTYYMVEDLLVAKNNAQKIGALKGFPKFLYDPVRQWISRDEETLYFSMTYKGPNYLEPKLSAHPDHLYYGGSVTYSALQLALIMGCDPIYLIGVDFNFRLPPAERREGNELIQEGEVNHFHPQYRSPGERWHVPDDEFTLKAYELAKEQCDKRGIKIFNATRGGKLEVFPRVELDSLCGAEGI
jgi:hypothetical protein